MPSSGHGPDGLTPLQRGFVDAVIDGAPTATAAAGIAGYSGPSSTLAVRGHELTHKPTVVAAIRARAAELGLTPEYAISRLKFAMDDDKPGVRAPMVRATELALRLHGALEPEGSITVDARSIIVPGAGAASVEALEALLEGLNADSR